MGQLLAGEIPEGSKCDVKSLCVLAGVARASFYRTYPHLRAEFEHELGRLRDAGQQPEPRLAQIERLKAEVVGLRARLSQTASQIVDLEAFGATAMSRLASQHDEILGLRARLEVGQAARMRNLHS